MQAGSRELPMSSEQMIRAAATMASAAEQMNNTYNWWQAEQERIYLRNLELVQRFEAAAAKMAECHSGGSSE